MDKSLTKKIISIVVAVIIGVAVIGFYFAPEFSGKRLTGGDIVSSTAWSEQNINFKERTGETAYWNPSMFSGMPWGLLTLGRSDNYTSFIDKGFRLFVSKPTAGLIIKSFIVAMIGLLLLNVNVWVALICSLAFAINVNFIVLLEAGHQSKVNVLANFPLILSGLILCFRSKYLPGAIAIAIGTSLAIYGNHIQMVYYLLMAFVLFGLSYLISAFRKKEIVPLFKGVGFALLAAIIGAASNYGQLTSSNSFAKDTMRGAPILSAGNQASASSAVDGLDWEYAMGWSNEVKDLYSFFVPRSVGGSSYEEVPATTELGRLLASNGYPRGSDGYILGPIYWGTLPFTSGPYYAGILILFLSMIAMFIVKTPMRWGLLAAIILIAITSMGRNGGMLNSILFENLPLYNKFRSPNSAVNLIPIFLLFLSGLGLNEIIKSRNLDSLIRPVLYAAGVLAALLGFIFVAGMTSFDFSNPREAQMGEQVLNVFIAERESMFKSDLFRSFGIFLVGFLLIGSYVKGLLKSKAILLGCLGVLAIGDTYLVNNRHLDSDNFESIRKYESKFAPRPVDTQIFNLEPKGRGYYRVLDNAINTYGSAHTSFHHNTIGGYHPAKLQRFEDIKNYYLMRGTPQVINMLNAKYVVDQNKQLQVNSDAYGAAWFVKNVRFVNTPNEEIEALDNLDTRNEAVVLQSDFSEVFSGPMSSNGEGSIELTKYDVNELHYTSNSSTAQTAIFSETWYDGWEATVNGQPADIFRANYILRGLNLPAGQNEIVFQFRPKAPGGIISTIFSLIILLALAYGLFQFFKNLNITGKTTREESIASSAQKVEKPQAPKSEKTETKTKPKKSDKKSKKKKSKPKKPKK